MSADAPIRGDEPDMLAAEYALGVLDGEGLAEARRRAARDPAFAREVEAWRERFAPLLDEIEAVAPPGNIWPSIEAALDPEGDGGANVVALRRRVSMWRGYGAAITAVAAVLALALALDATSTPPTLVAPGPAAPAPTLVASLSSADSPARLVVSYDPDGRSFLVTPAVLNSAAGHDHELWLIPPDGTPRSLGLVRADSSQRIVIPVALLRELSDDASIALSVEPVGGSPTGLPTGPVIAAGKLTRI